MDEEALPACFSEIRFYRNWRAMVPRCGSSDRDVTICADCLPSYQMRMKRAGRCSNPGVVFRFTEDGAIVGVVGVPA